MWNPFYTKYVFLKRIFRGTQVLFAVPLIPLFWTFGDICSGFWTSSDICPGFQTRVDLLCAFSLVWSSDSPLVQHLLTTYLRMCPQALVEVRCLGLESYIKYFEKQQLFWFTLWTQFLLFSDIIFSDWSKNSQLCCNLKIPRLFPDWKNFSRFSIASGNPEQYLQYSGR